MNGGGMFCASQTDPSSAASRPPVILHVAFNKQYLLHWKDCLCTPDFPSVLLQLLHHAIINIYRRKESVKYGAESTDI